MSDTVQRVPSFSAEAAAIGTPRLPNEPSSPSATDKRPSLRSNASVPPDFKRDTSYQSETSQNTPTSFARRPSTISRHSSGSRGGGMQRQTSGGSNSKERRKSVSGEQLDYQRQCFKDNRAIRKSVTKQLALERQATHEDNLIRLSSQSRATTFCRVVVESKIFMALATCLTLYALSADDLRLIFTNKPADIGFNGMTIFCVAVFFSEIVMSCVGREDYFLSFFFVLDTISTSTLALDLTWVSEGLLQGDEEDMDNLKGSKTAKLGARAARIVRVLRLIRILKLYKAVYEARAKAALERRRKKKTKAKRNSYIRNVEDWHDDADDNGFEDIELSRESQVGKRLTELTTIRIIVLVLAMMLVLPFLTLDKAEQLPTTAAYGAELVFGAFNRMELDISYRGAYERALLQYVYYHNWFTANGDGCHSNELCPADYFNSVFWVGIAGRRDHLVISKSAFGQVRPSAVVAFSQYLQSREKQYSCGTMPSVAMDTLGSPWNQTCRTKNGMLRRGFSLLEKEIPGVVSYSVRCPEDLRAVERMKFYPHLATSTQSLEWHFAFYVDARPYIQNEAMFNVYTTVFICAVLLLASVCITSDANSMVLKPVETMILKVDMIRINPLMAAKLADDAFKLEERKKAKESQVEQSRTRRLYAAFFCKSTEVAQPMETIILEKTIIKLGTLLALGFGEAGANIIGQNMSGSDSAMVDAMVPGELVDCIIGHARIRDFETVTEVLQVEVMAFVNQVAEIIHGVCDEFHGAANRNNGDTFLLIWPTVGLSQSSLQKMADMSIMALIRMFGALNRSATLAQYRNHPGLQLRLGTRNGRSQPPRVSLGFGLHCGWAIEGATGSEFKIDASYLSPNVNIAETLERATEVYGVVLLITEAVLKISSDDMAGKCRVLDRVTIQGCSEPLRLYVIDLSWFFLSVEPPLPDPRWNSRQRFRCRQLLEAEKVHKIAEQATMAELFHTSLEVNAMRAPFTLEFMQIFNMGYWNYSQGEWQVARRILKNTCTLLGFEDGPSAALLRYMEKPFEFESPPGWRGIHHLESNGQLGIPMNEQGKPLLKSSEKKTKAQREAELLKLAAESDGPSPLNPTGAVGSVAADQEDQQLFGIPLEDVPFEEPAQIKRRIVTLMNGEMPTCEIGIGEEPGAETTDGEVDADESACVPETP